MNKTKEIFYICKYLIGLIIWLFIQVPLGYRVCFRCKTKKHIKRLNKFGSGYSVYECKICETGKH